jgi:hypothetical protein
MKKAKVALAGKLAVVMDRMSFHRGCQRSLAAAGFMVVSVVSATT